MKIKLLFEAVDISSHESLFKAIERGQVPGVSLKKILLNNKNTNEKQKITFVKNNLLYLINKVKEIPENRKNLYSPIIMLILKKAKNSGERFFELEKYFNSVDPYLAYFLNKDKQEAKTKYKKLFDDFENSDLDIKKDHDFEQKANSVFAQKSKIKDYGKEVEVIYPQDDEGWEVLSPKTFAASSKLACMNNRKSKWCTAASEGMFSNYTKNENKLFIIRNEKKDIMYQMDFGYYNYANFMNERDSPATLAVFLKNKPPKELLKSIKNKKGESLLDKIGEDKLDKIESSKKEIKEKLKKEEIQKGKLKIEVFKTPEDLEETYPIFFEKGINIQKKEKKIDTIGLVNKKMSSVISDGANKIKKQINVEKIKKDLFVFTFENKKYLYLEGLFPSYFIKNKTRRIIDFPLFVLDGDKLELITMDKLDEVPEEIRKIVRKKGIVQRKSFYEKVKEELNDTKTKGEYEVIYKDKNNKIFKIKNLKGFINVENSGIGSNLEKFKDFSKVEGFFKFLKFPIYRYELNFLYGQTLKLFKNNNSVFFTYIYEKDIFKQIKDVNTGFYFESLKNNMPVLHFLSKNDKDLFNMVRGFALDHIKRVLKSNRSKQEKMKIKETYKDIFSLKEIKLDKEENLEDRNKVMVIPYELGNLPEYIEDYVELKNIKEKSKTDKQVIINVDSKGYFGESNPNIVLIKKGSELVLGTSASPEFKTLYSKKRKRFIGAWEFVRLTGIPGSIIGNGTLNELMGENVLSKLREAYR